MPRQRVMGLPILVVLWAVTFLPGLLSGRILPARDIGATQIPWRTIWAGQVESGTLPLWDPLSNGGRALLANPNAMAAYPGSLLFLLLAPEPAAVWHIALHHLALLLALYTLCRRSGADAAAAALAAAAVGTCGVAWSATTFLNLQASLAWGAWALAVSVPAPRDRKAAVRRGALAGCFLGISFLAGEPVTAGLAAFAWVVVVGCTWSQSRLRGPLLAAAMAVLVSAPVLVPLLAILPETVRGTAGVDPGALSADTLAPRRWIELFLPRVLGEPLGDGGTGFWAAAAFPWQRYFPLIFVGLLPLLVFPWIPRGRQWRPWWFIGLAGLLGSVLLAWEPAHRLAASLPGVGGVRFGIRLLVLPFFAAAPLLAAAWPRFAADWKAWGRRATWAVTALGIAVTASAVGPDRLARPALTRMYPEAAAGLAKVPGGELSRSLLADGLSLAGPAAALLALGPSAPAALAGLAASNVLAGRAVLRWDDRDAWRQPPALAELIPGGSVVVSLSGDARLPSPASDRGLIRFQRARTALEPNYLSRWGLGSILHRGPDGLEPSLHDQLTVISRGLPLEPTVRLARNLGASVVIAEEPIAGWICHLADCLFACTSPEPAPPAYLATRLLGADDLPAVRDTLASAAFVADADAVVGAGRSIEPLAGGNVEEFAGPPHRRTFLVSSPGESLLVVRQSYSRQWRARARGIPFPVIPVNGCQIGVRLPAGEHRVEVFLNPVPYRIGAAGPVLALLLGIIAFRPRKPAADGNDLL